MAICTPKDTVLVFNVCARSVDGNRGMRGNSFKSRAAEASAAFAWRIQVPMDGPLFVALVLSIAATDFLARHALFLRRVLDDIAARQPQIDGLRGICAAMVVVHHLVYLSYWKAGIWTLPTHDRVAATAGKIGVALFFLICAFLFWGRVGKIGAGPRAWLAFLVNRVRRIVPMYVTAMASALVLLGLMPVPFNAWLPNEDLLTEGAKAFSFWFWPPTHFNGQALADAAVGVAWTLRYEWLFYASLPLIAFSRLHRYGRVLLPALIAANEAGPVLVWYEYFAYGCLINELVRFPFVRRVAGSQVGSVASIALILFTAYFAGEGELGSGWPALALSLAFLPIAAGADWFGILASPGARLVGAASYSVYLVNLIVSAGLVALLPSSPALWSSPRVAIVFAVFAMATYCVSLLTYRWIERPFQKKNATRLGLHLPA